MKNILKKSAFRKFLNKEIKNKVGLMKVNIKKF